MTVPLLGRRLGLHPPIEPSTTQQTRSGFIGSGRHRAPGLLEKLQRLAVRAEGRSPTGPRKVFDFSQFHEIYGIGYIGGDIVPGPRGLLERF